MTRAPKSTVLQFGLLLLAGCDVTFAPSCDAQGRAQIDVHDGAAASEPAAPGSGSTPLGACPGSPRSGVTSCFPSECGPGQFCDDRHGLAECRPGCTSDENCGPRDACVRPAGAALGRCESCDHRERRTLAGCGAPDRRGITPCFPGECSPGQYCIDAARCEPGCTSDENCGPTERCEREGGATVGVCRSCDFVPPA